MSIDKILIKKLKSVIYNINKYIKINKYFYL